jgi:hypothetical protein
MPCPSPELCWICGKPAPAEELKGDEFGFFADEPCLKVNDKKNPRSASA